MSAPLGKKCDDQHTVADLTFSRHENTHRFRSIQFELYNSNCNKVHYINLIIVWNNECLRFRRIRQNEMKPQLCDRSTSHKIWLLFAGRDNNLTLSVNIPVKIGCNFNVTKYL